MKNTSTQTTSAVVIPATIPKDTTLVAIIAGYIVQGVSRTAILDAYVAGRQAEFRKRPGQYAAALAEGTEKGEAKFLSLVRKHGGHHFNLALASLSPVTAQERKEKAVAGLERAKASLARAEAKAAQVA